MHTHTHTQKAIHKHTNCSYQINLAAGVSHVAEYAAVLHSLQMFPSHHVFIACRENQMKQTVTATVLMFFFF